jgi:hypothetical protein
MIALLLLCGIQIMKRKFLFPQCMQQGELIEPLRNRLFEGIADPRNTLILYIHHTAHNYKRETIIF